MTFQEQVQRDAAIEVSAFEFAKLAEAMNAHNAIVFIYARWSGAAVHAWRTLTTAVAKFEKRPRIFVVDADEVEPRVAADLMGELPQGKGETLWVSEGKTIARLSAYKEADAATLVENTKRLVK